MAHQKSQSALATPVRYIKGIGPKRAAALRRRNIHTVGGLLYYFPRDYLDFNRVEKIGILRRFAGSDKQVTVRGTVRTFDVVGRPPKQRFVVMLGDESGTVPLVFFRNVHYFKKAFRVGEMLAVSGRLTLYQNRPQLVHPGIDRLDHGEKEPEEEAGLLHTRGIVPKYSSSEDLQEVHLETKGFRRVMKAALDEFLTAVEDFMPGEILDRNRLLPLQDAIRHIHFPGSPAHLEEARRRLKFDELFLLELILALRRMFVKVETPGIPFSVQSNLARQLVDSLPFRLTRAQVRVIREIADDMRTPKPMNRLLQGDVGSGKTVVALTSLLIAVDNGYQAAFMAPTEVLAEQHFHTLRQFLQSIPVTVRLLVGGQKQRLRNDILEDIRRGSAQIVVGTHALIQQTVDFAKLGLVVIDEQHRFGVAQRLALREKGFVSHAQTAHPDVLIMTATPIPRTLSFTIYGDLDVSVIDELPHDRKPIRTMLKFESQRAWVHTFVREQIAIGKQAYIVYPLVEESEKLDLKAATESFEHLRQAVFPDLRTGLIHGRMASDEKEAVMDALKRNALDILVATTVIEVGIDVPNVTVMVVEHAERFGLSQLHQLRGRVGRGAEQSYCILIAPDWMAARHQVLYDEGKNGEAEERKNAGTRLQTMLQTTDGFRIAEVDLRLRGPGDFFGTRQSGFPEFRIADILSDSDILAVARREAFQLIDRDPHVRLPDHQDLRKHLSLQYAEQLGFLPVV